MNIQRFLTYSEISDNEVHKGVSIDIGDLTLEEIKKAIDNFKSLKEKNINKNIKNLNKIGRRQLIIERNKSY